MLHGLGDGELHEHLAAERQHHDEERKPATGIADRDGSVGPPADLRTLAGSEVQLEIDRPLGRPDAADVVAQNRDAAAVSFLAQTLEDLLSAVGAGVQQPRDARLEGVKDTAARSSGPGDHGSRGFCRTARNRSRPAPPSGTGAIARAADVARMSWPSRSKRPVVRTMSSCNGVPTIWAIKPIRTAG